MIEGRIQNNPSGSSLATKPTRAISKLLILRQIKAAKKNIMSYSGFASPAACLYAMEAVADVALLVGADSVNTPAGWDSVHKMRARLVNLENM